MVALRLGSPALMQRRFGIAEPDLPFASRADTEFPGGSDTRTGCGVILAVATTAEPTRRDLLDIATGAAALVGSAPSPGR